MESWGQGGLFVVDWSGTYDNVLEELTTKQKVAGSKFEYRGKPEEWTSEVWREVYNLPKASLRGYIMKGKVQFTELQQLLVVKGERRMSVRSASEASKSKPLGQKVDFAEWGNRVESFGHETSKLFEPFHVENGSVTMEAVVRNMKEMFTPPPVVETNLQPWKEMVRNLVDLLTEEQKRIKAVIE
ncbi:hypothetical protein R1flu_004201 [Riccia fluitans]|uniref:Uncharacterized protein n=1 Tax=Riccia fluitans TaxID=41844 RepID=A0ABD1YTK8_9MARC